MEDKNSQWCYFEWGNLQWVFCDVGCSCSFIFVLHLLLLSFFFIYLLFGIIPHSSVDCRRAFTPILYFQSSPSQSNSQHFYFQLFRYLLTASATVLSAHFLRTGVFYQTVLNWHFTCIYQGLPGSQQFFLEIYWPSYWSSKYRRGPSICLIHSNPQSS